MNMTRCLIACLGLLAASSAAQNLLPNGGFEQGVASCTDQGVMPAPWVALNSTPDVYSFSCIDNPGLAPTINGNFSTLPNAHDGLRFAAGWGSAFEDFATPIVQPIVAGHEYVLSGWFTKSWKHTAPGGYEMLLGTGPYLFGTSVGLVGEATDIGSWTYDSLTFVAPVDATWILFFPLPGQDCYDGLDDLVLVEQPFADLGGALSGSQGNPVLEGAGTLVAGQPLALTLTSAQPASTVALVIGTGLLGAPFKGGTMIPTIDIVIAGLSTGMTGTMNLAADWPTGVPVGLDLFMQAWIQDPAGPHGFSASNGVKAHANGP